MQIEVWIFILSLVGALIVGAVIGFFGARYFFKQQLKKNPPINEKMIRAMFLQMGRKASESQVRAVMNSMKRNQ